MFVFSNKIDFCNAYQYGKLHQFSFPLSQLKSTAPFQIVHSDVWGPSPQVSHEGYRFYVHFVDDFTKYTWNFPLKTKSEARIIFCQFNSFVERNFNSPIKYLQTNLFFIFFLGGWCEYRSLLPLLKDLGIVFRHPCPHTHQQNGRAERKHRHIHS